MSQQELHVGTLTEVKLKEGQTTIDLMKEIMDEHNEKYGEDSSLETNFLEACIESYCLFENKIYKVVDTEFNDDICLATKNDNGTISFVLGFYNGGTCFSEMLDEALKLLK